MPMKPEVVKLTENQKRDGYRAERLGDSVLVWHKNTRIAVFPYSLDINHRVQQLLERRRRQLK